MKRYGVLAWLVVVVVTGTFMMYEAAWAAPDSGRYGSSGSISGKGPMNGGSVTMGGAGGTSDGSTSSGMGSSAGSGRQ